MDELRSNIDLREDLAILGDDVRSNIRPQLTRWSVASAIFTTRIGGYVALLLAGLNVFSIIYYTVYGPIFPMITIALISIAFARIHRRRALSVLSPVNIGATPVLPSLHRSRFKVAPGAKLN